MHRSRRFDASVDETDAGWGRFGVCFVCENRACFEPRELHLVSSMISTRESASHRLIVLSLLPDTTGEPSGLDAALRFSLV